MKEKVDFGKTAQVFTDRRGHLSINSNLICKVMTHPFLSNFNHVDSKIAIELTNIFSDTSYVKGIPTNEQQNDLFI